MMQPSVTVVVPAYNAALFLGSALESALSQTCREAAEIVVVDDGSTDRTGSVAAGFGRRIRLLTQAHAGAAAARNLGVGHARAPIVAFLDSDDLWHPDHLETLLRLLRNDPRAIGATSGMELLTTDGRPAGPTWVFGSEAEDFGDAVHKGCPLLMSASAVRRQVILEADGFDESLTTAEDWDLWLRVLPLGRMARAGRVTAGYRRHSGAVSMNHEKRAENRRRIAAKYAQLPWGHVLAAYMEMHDARQALAAGQEGEADRSLERAARLHPEITNDLQWWAFFESFRPHDRPDAFSRFRFWQAVRAYGHVCGTQVLPFRRRQRWQAMAAGLGVARAFARNAGLRPEMLVFAVLELLAQSLSA